MRKYLITFSLCALSLTYGIAQSLSSSEILLKMERLNVLGSVLYFAAHPDDENTRLISYLASERKVRTAYLSLTRGDGGQNLIGTELGVELGMIRTHELLQARKTDGGEQYFSSAYDFGFSKTYDETFRFWDKEAILGESVLLIRKLRPDVIITRFPPDERGGHGHHQASAILAHEAFIAAADPKRFPEQLDKVEPWQAKRLIWNTANFMNMQGESQGQLKIDIGAYNPLLGKSYGEIAAVSRSQHKSQGFGAAATTGRAIESFEHVAGEKATVDLFDNVDLSWNKLTSDNKTAQTSLTKDIEELIQRYNPLAPQASIPQLAKLWKQVQNIKDSYWRKAKSKEIEDLILACSGLKIENIAPQAQYVKGENITFDTEIISRNIEAEVCLLAINDEYLNATLKENELHKFSNSMTLDKATQPYWLVKPQQIGRFQIEHQDTGSPLNRDLPAAEIKLEIAGIEITTSQNLTFRYVDPVRGEVHEPISVSPKITAASDKKTILLQDGETTTVELTFQNHQGVAMEAPIALYLGTPGWEISPKQFTLAFAEGQTYLSKTITVRNNQASAPAKLSLSENNKPLTGFSEIAYEHIDKQSWFPPLAIDIRPIDLINPVKRVGYIMGAADLVPDALRLLNIEVDMLTVDKISPELLKTYDAVVFGIRIMNVNKQIAQKLPVIYDYVKQGGVVLMQYNVNSGLSKEDFAPAPFKITRARVTEEHADVRFLNPEDPALNYPNKITAADFEGWVQERGLYFAEDIDTSYRTPLSINDTGESPHNGSLLINRLGKGKFVYTSLSFFRQLPAGVPGANRLFVNLLAKEN